MTNPQTTSILGNDSFITGETVKVEIPHGDGKLALNVREIGYAETQVLYGEAHRAKTANPFAHLVAASVTDDQGRKFTVDEVNRLKKEVAEPLFKQVLKFQGVDVGEPAAEGADTDKDLSSAPK